MLEDGLQTTRQRMITLLRERECTAREVSQMLGIREKDVYEHLSHIARSVASRKLTLVVTVSRCLGCGYEFGDRKRFKKPSRCPHCRGEQIEVPRYRIG